MSPRTWLSSEDWHLERLWQAEDREYELEIYARRRHESQQRALQLREPFAVRRLQQQFHRRRVQNDCDAAFEAPVQFLPAAPEAARRAIKTWAAQPFAMKFSDAERAQSIRDARALGANLMPADFSLVVRARGNGMDRTDVDISAEDAVRRLFATHDATRITANAASQLRRGGDRRHELRQELRGRKHATEHSSLPVTEGQLPPLTRQSLTAR